MDPFATSHFSNRALLHDFDTRVVHDHASLAILLTRIAEIDARRLYLPEGYPSMKAFLVQRMRLPTENAAFKRLTAARLACKYPGILVALSDGRLHLTAVLMLGTHLTPANADELVAAALDKTCFELEVVLAQRFPRPDLPERLEAISTPGASLLPSLASWSEDSLAARRVEATMPEQHAHKDSEPPLAPQLAAGRVEGPRPRVVPLAPQKFGFQFTADQETHELYERLRALMSHEIPTGEMALVFKGALRIAVDHYMKRKFAATDRPGQARGSADPRHIPAAVKREVHERDQGRCTFVGDSGTRCASRRFLEYDHEIPVANGGEATVENIRLRCRAHNQHAAERVFGVEFMARKRAEARVRARARAQKQVAPAADRASRRRYRQRRPPQRPASTAAACRRCSSAFSSSWSAAGSLDPNFS